MWMMRFLYAATAFYSPHICIVPDTGGFDVALWTMVG
jgi:hypothetical protein